MAFFLSSGYFSIVFFYVEKSSIKNKTIYPNVDYFESKKKIANK